ncbi:Os10g0360900, partial [Oryza sativa Japonica Group]
CSPPFSSRPVFPRRAAVAVAFLHPARDQRCRHRGSCRGQGSSESGMASPDACVEDKVHRIFLDFMTKVARYDELVDAGKKVLLKFHQEVEHFWRPKLLTESSAIIEIVKSNYSDRMRSYLEAGCTHHNEIIQNMNRLHAYQEKLNDHINKAKLLLEELQFLEEDVYSAALTASLSSSRNTDDCPDHDNLTNVCSEDEQQPEDWLDGAVSFASVIVLVHNMLKMDYMMQEKIVKAFWVKTSSSEIEGYCQMWDLRPYIDDNVMQLAWQLVP